MRILVLYPYPVEPDGQSLQGHYLVKGLRELGHTVFSCDRGNDIQKDFFYKHAKPDVVIGVGFWGDTPDLVTDPLANNLRPVPWLNADGWVANYHDILESLPLVLTTSNWVKSTYIRDGLSGKNLRVAPIGYNQNIFKKRSEEDRKTMRKLLGINDNEKMLFTAGGDVTSKGAQEILRALGKIDKDFPNWKYVCKIYPSPSARNHGREERRLIKELGLNKKKVSYLEGEYSPEFMSYLLNACDIYVAPSRIEGFGMIQVEAQACGKPVISINVGGPKDTVVHDKTGFLVDVSEEIKLDREWVYEHMGFDEKHQIEFVEPKTFSYRANIDQLSESLSKLLKDDELRKRMGDAAAHHAFNNFNMKVTAKNIVGFIEKIN